MEVDGSSVRIVEMHFLLEILHVGNEMRIRIESGEATVLWKKFVDERFESLGLKDRAGRAETFCEDGGECSS